jgi:hypothetical protein
MIPSRDSKDFFSCKASDKSSFKFKKSLSLSWTTFCNWGGGKREREGGEREGGVSETAKQNLL